MSSIFGSQNIWKEPNFVPGEHRCTAYTFPMTSGPQSNLNLALAIIEAFKNTEPPHRNDREWVTTYILTVSELIMPGLIDALNHRRKIAIKKELLEGFPIHHFDPSIKGQREESYNAGFITVAYDDRYQYATPELVGGRWGIEMLPIGRNVYETNVTDFSVKQPQILQPKYNLTGPQLSLLRGSLAPTYDKLRTVHCHFNCKCALRHELVCEWIRRLKLPGESPQQLAFLEVFKQTNGYGLYGASLILDLLQEYPELATCSVLRSEINTFVQCMKTHNEQPDKGSIKVKYGDMYRIFKDCTRGCLMAVAVKHARQFDSRSFGHFDLAFYEKGIIPGVNRFLRENGYDPIGEANSKDKATYIPKTNSAPVATKPKSAPTTTKLAAHVPNISFNNDLIRGFPHLAVAMQARPQEMSKLRSTTLWDEI